MNIGVPRFSQRSTAWHMHAHEDEIFLVWQGTMVMEFREQMVTLDAGELFVVPRGIEHRTIDSTEAEIIIFEPAETRNTGNIYDVEFTAPNNVPFRNNVEQRNAMELRLERFLMVGFLAETP